MTPFAYQNDSLHAEGVALTDIAAQVGTPVYVYSANRIRANYQRLHDALAPLGSVQLCYAVKANSNQAILSLLGKSGAGADIVSGGELARALAAGIPASKIVFSGVGKTQSEMEAALTAGIHQINVESIPELQHLSAVAVRLGVTASVALRVNPDVAADTHHKIATGAKGNKFGIDHEQVMDAAALARDLPGLNLVGIALHIGSHLMDIETYRAAYQVAAKYVQDLRSAGHTITRLDLGGGMGVPYRDGGATFDAPAYARMVQETLGSLDCSYSFEPGRYLVADAAVLLSRVLFIKQGVSHRFVVVDAAMNDLIRPTLYEAFHNIRPVMQPAADAPLEPADVVGPICESGDFLAQQRPLPPMKTDDLIVVDHGGAYGAVMAGTYNTRALVPEVLVDGTRWSVIRPRIDAKAQIGWDVVPEWV